MKFYNFLKKKLYQKRVPPIFVKEHFESFYLEDDFITLKPSKIDLKLFACKQGYVISFGSPLISSVEVKPIPIVLEDNVIRASNHDDIVLRDYQIIVGDKLAISIYHFKKWLKIELKHRFDHYFGLGEKNGPLDKSGHVYEMWNSDNAEFEITDDPLYKSYPVLILGGLHDWMAVIVDYPGYQKWNLKKDEDSIIYINSTEFNFIFLTSSSPLDLVKSVYDLTGHMEMPPLWAIGGYHQCKWSYFPASKALEVAELFLEKDIPLDVLYLDIDYMEGYRCFTWDSVKFGDIRNLIEKLHNLGIKVVVMIDPGIKVDPNYHLYQEMIENDYYVLNGEKPYIGSVWPGACIFPDFFNPEVREWWGELYREFVEMGIDGVWNDMNEPSIFDLRGTFPDDVTHLVNGNLTNNDRVHNLYGQMMARASYSGLKNLNGKRVFLLSRSAFLGSQKYGWIWTGDNRAEWDHLAQSIPKLLNSGISGHMASGADIGGFRDLPSGKLYARWIALGCFYPLMRTHTSTFTTDQEPWSFGSEVEEISRKFIKLRLELSPYVYTWFWYAITEGIPLLRPLWLEFPDDPMCYESIWMDTQFMFGPSLLVAPVITEKDARPVYLPQGTWYDYFSTRRYEGGQIIEFDVDLDELILLVRDNSIVPTLRSVGKNLESSWKSGFEYRKFGDEATGFLYLDDGISYDYQNGNYGWYKITTDKTLQLLKGTGVIIE